MAVILVSYAGPLVNLFESYRQVGTTESELARIERENRQLERHTRHLNSESVLKREARRQGLTFPGERAYVIDGVGR